VSENTACHLTEHLTVFRFAMHVNEFINCTFQFKKVRKMQNLGNVYICGSLFVMSRTDAQNGHYSIFEVLKFWFLKRSSTCLILNWWLEVLIMLKTSFDEKLANAKLKPWQKNKMSWDSCRLVGNKPEQKNNGGVRHIYNQYRIF
jgi:hypothetical protein